MNREKLARLGWKVLRWGGIVVAVLLIVGFTLPIVGPVPFEFAGLVLFGWFGYLQRISSEVSPDPGVIIGAIVALGVATWALHHVLRWWRVRTAAEPARWRFGWTVRITILVLVLFGASLAVGCVVHQVAWLCEEAHLIETRGMGKQTKELSKIKQVATVMKIYATDHQGRFPKQLDEMVPDYLVDHEMLFTPALPGDPPQRIIYYPGYKDTDASDTIVLASPRIYRTGTKASRVIAHIDTTTMVVRESKYQELMQKQSAAGLGGRPGIDAASDSAEREAVRP
jgi:hypothetical protein